jgi:hypothetical protein
MKTHATRPLVFLAFANDMDDYLVNLKEESRAVFDALRPLEQESAIAVHREESVEVNELYTDLLGFDGQIVLFHYAGHANGKMLQLEGGNGAAGGLAKLLGQQQTFTCSRCPCGDCYLGGYQRCKSHDVVYCVLCCIG